MSALLVESYKVEEVNSSEAATMAADSTAIELCNELGLKGQLKLADEKTATRLPFRPMSTEEWIVFSVLFPEMDLIEDYNSGIIPVRVLELVREAKQHEQCKWVFVMHPSDARATDPVVFARESRWSGTNYLIARWGTALAPFETLRKQAVTKFQNRLDARLASVEATFAAYRKNPVAFIEARIDAGDMPELV